jgi:hypothetical protein
MRPYLMPLTRANLISDPSDGDRSVAGLLVQATTKSPAPDLTTTGCDPGSFPLKT